MKSGIDASFVPTYARMSTVEVSAQCRSSKNSTSGLECDASCRKIASSRFIRSCEMAGDSRIRRSTDPSCDVAS